MCLGQLARLVGFAWRFQISQKLIAAQVNNQMQLLMSRLVDKRQMGRTEDRDDVSDSSSWRALKQVLNTSQSDS